MIITIIVIVIIISSSSSSSRSVAGSSLRRELGYAPLRAGRALGLAARRVCQKLGGGLIGGVKIGVS